MYSESYQKSVLLSYLTHEDFTKKPSYIKKENSIVSTFQCLIDLNIPCVWQVMPSQEKEMVVLELWVFWFDDKHTGLIDDHSQLKELKGNHHKKKAF